MVQFQGADISHYQNEKGPIDWPSLKMASVGSWFACKATQRANYKDPYFDYNRESAHTIGFRYIMMYHWLSPVSQARVVDQVGFYLSKVGKLQLNEGVMIDAEEGGITLADTLEFADRVEQKTGRPCSIYTGAFVAGGSIWTSQTLFNGLRARHLAAYTSEQKMKALPGVDPPLPAAWQYSSNGPVPGIVGRCDMNFFYDISMYDLICGIGTLPKPLPEEESMDLLVEAESAWESWPEGQLYIQDAGTGHVRAITDWEWNAMGQKKPVAKWSNEQLSYCGLAPIPGNTDCKFAPLTVSLTGTAK